MRHALALAALAGLAACTADNQGERFAAASPCGAADVKGIIGYPIGQIHLPYGTDRVQSVGTYDPTRYYGEFESYYWKGKRVIAYDVSQDERMNVLVDAHGMVVDVICY